MESVHDEEKKANDAGHWRLGVLTQAYNPLIWAVELRGSEVQGHS